MRSCQSEYGQIEELFLKRVEDSFLDEQHIDTQWQDLHYVARPSFAQATQEYEAFQQFFQQGSCKIHHFPAHAKTGMDSMYCRDASIATDQGMILCHMGKPQRQGETLAAEQAYQRAGIPILGRIRAPGTIEGGDVAWLDPQTLAVGHGYRSNQAGFDQLAELLRPLGIQLIQVHLPHYKGPGDVFHLMSIFSPIDKDLAVVFSPLMSVAFRNELLDRGYQLVEVPEEEFESMGCNVLALGPKVCLMVQGNPQTKSRLEQAGCTVLEYAGSEISVKGGGGPTCLTRPLWRKL
ncbi:MAG: arginine deiminase family protein [Bacteroidota bacterium]